MLPPRADKAGECRHRVTALDIGPNRLPKLSALLRRFSGCQIESWLHLLAKKDVLADDTYRVGG